MAAILALVLASGLPFLSHFFRFSTWMVWGLLTAGVLSFGRELGLRAILAPLAPYLAWLFLYAAWGAIITEPLDPAWIIKVLATTLVLGGSAAVIASRPAHLRTFATLAQFAVVVNLAMVFIAARYPGINGLITAVTEHSASVEEAGSRYGGLWGNPNMAGYVCLVVLALSVFAAPWAAWMGRLCSLPLFYLSASRKSAILLVCILVLYALVVQGRNLKFWLLVLLTLASLGVAALVVRPEGRGRPIQDEKVARLVDVQERDMASRGGPTRVDLMKFWIRRLEAEPWYGYGLNAMAGTVRREGEARQGRDEVTDLGTHNTYLGVWIDMGPLGFLVFLGVMAHYAWTCLSAPVSPRTRWALVSFAMVNFVFLFVSHSHLFCFEGELAFTLLFLLPSSRGLRDLDLAIQEG
jgi:O-antigen ligase